MSEQPISQERRDDLLIQQAVCGLNANEKREMQELNRQFAESEPSFELAVAALDLAYASDQASQLPDPLRHIILDEADQFFSSIPAQETEVPPRPVLPAKPTEDVAPRRNRRETWWMLATAASLLLAFVAWYSSIPSPPPSLSQKLDQLIATPGTVEAIWKAQDDPAATNASGKVVWNDQQQRGFMIFNGMEVNDPNVQQYQLWIFDTARNDELPVDGGVFDITSSGEVIVPIDAKLSIEKAKLFAVTVERPGGVVRSDRERLPLLADDLVDTGA